MNMKIKYEVQGPDFYNFDKTGSMIGGHLQWNVVRTRRSQRTVKTATARRLGMGYGVLMCEFQRLVYPPISNSPRWQCHRQLDHG